MTSQDTAAWADSLARVRNLFAQLPNEKDIPVGQYIFSKTPSGAGVRVRECNASVPSAGLFYPLGTRLSADDITFNNKRLTLLTDTERNQATPIRDVTSLLTPQWISARSQMYSTTAGPGSNVAAAVNAPIGSALVNPSGATLGNPRRFAEYFKDFSRQLARIDEQTIAKEGGFGGFKKDGSDDGMWLWEKSPGSMRFPVDSHLRSDEEVIGMSTLNGTSLLNTTDAARKSFQLYLTPVGSVLNGMVTKHEAAKKPLLPKAPSQNPQVTKSTPLPPTIQDVFHRHIHDALHVLRSNMTQGDLIETGKYRIRFDKEGNFNIAPQGAPTPDDPPYIKLNRYCVDYNKEFLVNTEGFNSWPPGMQQRAIDALLDVKSWLEVNRRNA